MGLRRRIHDLSCPGATDGVMWVSEDVLSACRPDPGNTDAIKAEAQTAHRVELQRVQPKLVDVPEQRGRQRAKRGHVE